jgi:hypothetical protein
VLCLLYILLHPSFEEKRKERGEKREKDRKKET